MFGSEHKDGWRGFEGNPERNEVQQAVYSFLIPRLTNSIKGKQRNILDIGCGAGLFTNKIQELFPDAKVHGVDKLYPFEDQVGEGDIDYRQGDIELGLPYKNGIFQFCISKFVVMYLKDLGYHFIEVSRILDTQGEYFIVTFNPEYTLEKQRQLYKRDVNYGDEVEHEILGADLKVKLLLHSSEDYNRSFKNAGLEVISQEQVMFPNPKFEFARELPFANIIGLKKKN